jgi:hypothetical protein
LQLDEKLVELRRILWKKWRILGHDKEFVMETAKLKRRLERAFSRDKESVTRFFNRYSCPTGTRLLKLTRYINTIKEKEVRSVLWRYVKYVARFGVVLYFRKKQPHFRTTALVPWGAKFRAAIVAGHLKPVTHIEGPYIYEFEDDDLETPTALEQLVETGKSKFVRLDDKDGSSVLTEIESFAYHADGLTFILHHAEQPYIICLIGEKVLSTTLRAAARAIRGLQREYYGRVNAGRPPDIRQIVKISAALRNAGPSKAKAIDLGKTNNAETSQAIFSHYKKKLT